MLLQRSLVPAAEVARRRKLGDLELARTVL